MKIFITKLGPLVTEEQDPTAKIFLKADGTPLKKGTIGKRVSAYVLKSGIRPDKSISATDFRKWIATEMKRKKRMGIPIDEQLLRRLKCHSDKTANEWYLRENLTQQAVQASLLIEDHTKPSTSKERPHAGSSLSTSQEKTHDNTSLSKEVQSSHSRRHRASKRWVFSLRHFWHVQDISFSSAACANRKGIC